jgi:hypothetical protein
MTRTSPLLRSATPPTRDASSLEALPDQLGPVELIRRDALYESDERIPYVYFPLTGAISAVAEAEPAGVEVITSGNEGIVGVPGFLELKTRRLQRSCCRCAVL